MENFEFKSQVATSVEQSIRLLELGLKRETADMCYRELVNREHHTYYSLQCATPRNIDIPAWSLHRLLLLLDRTIEFEDWNLDEAYEHIIILIEDAIRGGLFNKDYLEEKK